MGSDAGLLIVLEEAVQAGAVDGDALRVDDAKTPGGFARLGLAGSKAGITGEASGDVKWLRGNGRGLVVWRLRLDVAEVDLYTSTES